MTKQLDRVKQSTMENGFFFGQLTRLIGRINFRLQNEGIYNGKGCLSLKNHQERLPLELIIKLSFELEAQ